MLLLIGASVASWAIIFRKRKLLDDARQAADRFEDQFWSGGDLAALYKSLEGGTHTGMADIFVSGFREFSRLRSAARARRARSCSMRSRRSMKVAQLKETDRLEQNLSTLATIGSTSPYVGLFGTVWGILTAFQALGNVQQATLATVAPAHRRGADRHGDGPVRRDPGRDRLQPLCRPGRAGSNCATTRSWKSCPPSCSATPAARRAEAGPTMSRRRGRKLMGEINVVPYIDVMLVLLIIFMVTAPMLSQGIKVDLPQGGGRADRARRPRAAAAERRQRGARCT